MYTLLIYLLAAVVGYFTDYTHYAEKEGNTFDLVDIQKRGYINVLMPVNTPGYYLYKGRPVGYEYEMASLLAKHLNVKLKIKTVDGVQDAVEKLQRGEGDLIAMTVDITSSIKEQVLFTHPFFMQRQVLVRRKPSSPRLELNAHNITTNAKIEKIRRAVPQIDLPVPLVANGAIPYTVSYEHTAKLFAFIYSNLDVSHAVSSPRPMAWSVRKNSPRLWLEISEWQKSVKKSGVSNFVYKKHFEMPVFSSTRMVSHYSSMGGKNISPYDDLLKKIGQRYNLDWRFLASVAQRESKFDAEVSSRSGALGLMQILPAYVELEEEEKLLNPENNIDMGAKKLRELQRYWSKSIADSVERVKFVLASYNVGLTHVQDAVILAKKNTNDLSWDASVSKFLLKKNEAEYYTDPDMKAGKCNCKSVVNYVDDVIHFFEEYKRYL